MWIAQVPDKPCPTESSSKGQMLLQPLLSDFKIQVYLLALDLERHHVLTSDNSGCSWILGKIPMPTALLIAFAIRRWFRLLKPDLSECTMRPVSVVKSDMSAKFCRGSISIGGYHDNLYTLSNQNKIIICLLYILLTGLYQADPEHQLAALLFFF